MVAKKADLGLNFKSKSKSKPASKGTAKKSTVPKSKTLSDMERLRQRYEELQASNYRSDFIKLENGDNVLRLLPQAGNAIDFYKESNQHFIQTINQSYNCLSDIGQTCPFCELEEALRNAGCNKTANIIQRSSRFTMNAVRDGNVGILQLGQGIMRKILEAMLDDKIGIITDLNKGRDICIKRSEKNKKVTYSLVTYDRSKASFKGEPLEDLSRLIKYQSQEDLEEALAEMLPDLKKKASFEIAEKGGNPKKDLPF